MTKASSPYYFFAVDMTFWKIRVLSTVSATRIEPLEKMEQRNV
jgi:hypothetical protein